MPALKRKGWFKTRAATADSPVAEVVIMSDIGYGGVMASDFDSALKAMGKPSKMKIRISSDGGDVSTGFAIFNMLARHPAHKTVVIEGLAASMASIIAMAGDEIVMPENAQMMIHNPWGAIVGEADQLASFAEGLKTMQDNMVATYAKRAKKTSAKEIRAMMERETWLSARQAKKLGFADRVVEPSQMDASATFDLRRFNKVPAAVGRILKGTSMTTNARRASVDESEFEGDDTRTEAQIRADVKKELQERAANITALCALAGFESLAAGFIDSEKTDAEVVAALAKAKSDKAEADKAAAAKGKGRGTVPAAGEVSTHSAPRTDGDAAGAPVEISTAAVYAKWNSAGKRKAA